MRKKTVVSIAVRLSRLGVFMRQFIRHPADVPIHISIESSNQDSTFSLLTYGAEMLDVCQGGVSIEIEQYISVGSCIRVDIDSVSPAYHGHGEVVWCDELNGHYEVGVRFLDKEESFRSRMVQQVCQIEVYKNMIFESEGRMLDGEQAAAEWIEKYAVDFP